jgi:hypothetical protein
MSFTYIYLATVSEFHFLQSCSNLFNQKNILIEMIRATVSSAKVGQAWASLHLLVSEE